MFAAFKNSMKTKIVDITKYRQIVGCLVYLIATRPDLTFDVFREYTFLQSYFTYT